LLSNGEPAPAKHIRTAQLAIICFCATTGGPFGIEPAVGAGGAFATLMLLLVCGVVWAVPQAAVTAELATMLPYNGGSIVWVRRALGTPWAFVNGLVLNFSQVMDLPLYPVLMASYVQQLVPSLSTGACYGIQAAAVLACCVVNIAGLDALSALSNAMTAFVLTPVLMLPIVAAAVHAKFDFSATSPAATPPGWAGSWSVLFSTVLWNFQGIPSLGNIAGEVADPQRAYPLGAGASILLTVLTYGWPVFFGVALQPDTSLWDSGYLVTVAENVAAWLGVWTLLAAAVSSFATFLSSMATYAHSLATLAADGMLPVPLLARHMTRWQTPVPAIVVLGVAALGLSMGLDFTNLVLIDTSLNNVSTVLVLVAFLRLRYTEPDIPRPFVAPGGMAGAWMLCVPCFCVAGFAFAVAAMDQWWAVAATAAAVASLYVIGWWLASRGAFPAADYEAVNAAARFSDSDAGDYIRCSDSDIMHDGRSGGHTVGERPGSWRGKRNNKGDPRDGAVQHCRHSSSSEDSGTQG
jgi:amino acid transporter